MHVETRTSDENNAAISAGVVDLARTWARFGLRLGAQALGATSRELRERGDLLADALAGSAVALQKMAREMTPPRAETEDAASEPTMREEVEAARQESARAEPATPADDA